MSRFAMTPMSKLDELAAAVLESSTASKELKEMAQQCMSFLDEVVAENEQFEAEIALAEEKFTHVNDNITIDHPNPMLSVGGDCVWVAAWVCVPLLNAEEEEEEEEEEETAN